MDPDRQALTQAGADLFSPDRGVWVVPVRHHSPACAWALTALIRAVRPTHVLIEGPEDFDRHIDTLLDCDTRPPVAIIALGAVQDGGMRTASHYPVSAHSPEYVALSEGRAAGAALRFIDLASSEWPQDRASSPDTSGDAEGTGPRPLQDDLPFTQGDYIAALCARTGCRDGHDLWDHLFESRLGTGDWQGFFADVGTYCAALRQASPPDALTLRREARMAAHLSSVLQTGGTAQTSESRIVVVVGGYHATALCARDPIPTIAGAQGPAPPAPFASYLVRYGFAAMDALGGYGAGLPLPGYYDRLWSEALASGSAPAWRETAVALVGAHASGLRQAGHAQALPALVEALRLAESLAALRGRPGPMRQDLLDAVRSAMVKGEASDRGLWTADFARFLRGDRLGEVTRRAGLPPLLADAKARAVALRFAVSDTTPRDRRLEVRRKPAHRAASAYLHAMDLLETGFARMTAGPDYAADLDPTHLHEHWTCGWSPRVEVRLIDCAALGDSLPAACCARLAERYDILDREGRRGDLPQRCGLLERGILAGLGVGLRPLADRLARDIDATSDFAALGLTLRRLVLMTQTAGPLRAPPGLDLGRLVQVAFHRLIWLIDGLAGVPKDDLPGVIDTLRMVTALIEPPESGSAKTPPDAGRLDGERLVAALERVADSDAPPSLLGAVLGLAVQAGRRDEALLAGAVSGGFRGIDLGEGRSALLAGMLRAAPAILCRDGPLMGAVDAYLGQIDEAAFLHLLPELRHAFSTLGPQEIGRLSALVARRHDPPPAGPTESPAWGSDNALAGRAVLDALQADGLQGWLDLALEDRR